MKMGEIMVDALPTGDILRAPEPSPSIRTNNERMRQLIWVAKISFAVRAKPT